MEISGMQRRRDCESSQCFHLHQEAQWSSTQEGACEHARPYGATTTLLAPWLCCLCCSWRRSDKCLALFTVLTLEEIVELVAGSKIWVFVLSVCVQRWLSTRKHQRRSKLRRIQAPWYLLLLRWGKHCPILFLLWCNPWRWPPPSRLQEFTDKLICMCLQIQSLIMEVCDETSIAELQLKVPMTALLLFFDMGYVSSFSLLADMVLDLKSL